MWSTFRTMYVTSSFAIAIFLLPRQPTDVATPVSCLTVLAYHTTTVSTSNDRFFARLWQGALPYTVRTHVTDESPFGAFRLVRARQTVVDTRPLMCIGDILVRGHRSSFKAWHSRRAQP